MTRETQETSSTYSYISETYPNAESLVALPGTDGETQFMRDVFERGHESGESRADIVIGWLIEKEAPPEMVWEIMGEYANKMALGTTNKYQSDQEDAETFFQREREVFFSQGMKEYIRRLQEERATLEMNEALRDTIATVKSVVRNQG